MTARPKKPWTLGDEGWEVETMTHIPELTDCPGEYDLDNATYESRSFRTREEAYAFACDLYKRSVSGSVSITPFVLERLCDDDPFHLKYNCHKEYTADSDYYEGDVT